MDETIAIHLGRQANASAAQDAVIDYEREQNYDEVVAAGNKLFDALQLVLSNAGATEIGVLAALEIVGAKESWAKAVGGQGRRL